MKPGNPPDYASAVEAARMLRVRPQTLYAYVSRGWIRSVSQPGRKEKLYLREDLLRVGSRSAARAGHGAVAAAAMNLGEPIFATAITEITENGPNYRGYPATWLAQSGASFESVAELLWTGVLQAQPVAWPVPRPLPDVETLTTGWGATLTAGNLLEFFAMVALLLGMQRGSIADRINQGETLVAARQIIQTIAGCCGHAGTHGVFCALRRGETVVGGLVRGLGVADTPENRTALEAILILLADHELSPGTLNARVVASGGGTLHGAIAAAFCATSGLDVGRRYDSVHRFLGRARAGSVLFKRAQRLLQQGQAVPGFHHPLYPKGDPRAEHLLALARSRATQTAESRAVFQFIAQMHDGAGLFPRHELAVVLLIRMMALPAPLSVAIFALARIPGWVAHVVEQRTQGTLLRPRAKFEQTAPP